MIATLLALASACSWGVSDFLGGLMSRRLPTTTVMVISQAFGLIGIGTAFLISGASMPDSEPMGYAIAAGAVGAIGLAAFYHALATGMVSLVAPIAATGAIVSVAVGLWEGEAVGIYGMVGIAAAITGVILASVAPASPEGTTNVDPMTKLTSIGLAIFAAVLFGAYFALFARATVGGLFGAALFQRITSVSAATAMWLVARRGKVLVASSLLPPGLTMRAAAAGLMGAGVLDVTANVLYGGASMQDLLSISSVLSSLYPVITVLMARVFLGERLAGIQGAGVVIALAGTTMIAAR
jgi:drug/metabolite transporter (DMT)-like permease